MWYARKENLNPPNKPEGQGKTIAEAEIACIVAICKGIE